MRNRNAVLRQLAAVVRIRLSPLLRQRVDESDIVQNALLAAAQDVSQFEPDPQRPFYFWLRHIAAMKLANEHMRQPPGALESGIDAIWQAINWRTINWRTIDRRVSNRRNSSMASAGIPARPTRYGRIKT